MALIERYLASGENGIGTVGGAEQQRTAQTVYESCGQQSVLHQHRHGERCNERCDIYPPKPEIVQVPVVNAVAEPVACSHGVGLDRDCGECSQEARLGIRPLRSGKAGEDARKRPER